MSIWQAIVLGLTQGASEYAPISSSGHLILVPWLFGWPIVADADLNKTFDVALHMGTLLGALIYFRRDVVRVTVSWFGSVANRRIRTPDEKLAWALVVGTIPGAAFGALGEGFIQDELGQPWMIASLLAVFGVVLWVVDKRAAARRGFDTIGVRTGLFLGFAQASALAPGVSRSGITMTAARAIGIDRESAARFSFLLSLPVIAGAGLYEGVDLVREGLHGYGAQFFWGFASSAVSGYAVVWFLLGYLKRHGYAVFMWYRLVAAAVVLAVVAAGVREATL